MTPIRWGLSLFAACLALGAPAAMAQRLAYSDVLGADRPAGPRLLYLPLDEYPLPPPAAAPESGLVHAFYADRIEYQAMRAGRGYNWDISAEIGSRAHRLWLASAGSGARDGGIGYAEGQALYSHPISEAGLALQAGVRRDFIRPRRTHAALGLQGNVSAPLYVGLFGYLSTRREVTGRFYAWYDWEPLARLVVQPFAGAAAAAEDMPELGLGRGLTAAELGLRVRYRLAEPFAPYVGLRYDRLLGRTADIAREAGDDVDAASLVLGLRSYF